MKKRSEKYPLLLTMAIFSGCASYGYESAPKGRFKVPDKVVVQDSRTGKAAKAGTTRLERRLSGKADATRVRSEGSTVHKKLMSQYHEWKGVPYQFGGMTKRGIDCSGFIHTTFRSKLGVDVPRSTELLSQSGIDVGRNHLKTGDLVFFKTAIKVMHVGVYLSNGNFLHASSSRGVMISNLSNVYWTKKYWKAKRITLS